MIQYILSEWPKGLIILLCIAVVFLAFFALLGVRDRLKDETAKALWSALILFIPIIGSITFLIVHPKEFKRVEERD